MQTNLDFTKQGVTFPPFEERERLNLYRENKMLFDGKHDSVFTRWTRTEGYESLNVVVNWPRRLSILWADMLFGNSPIIKGANDAPLKEFIERNDLYTVLYESAIDFSRMGTGLLKLRLSEEGLVVESVPTDIWFPVVNPANIKEVKQHVLAWKYKVTEGDVEKWYLNMEIHHKGKIEYRNYALATDSKVSTLIESSEEDTGVNDFLVFPVYNVGSSDRLDGISDYEDVKPILEELEMRLTQISRVLDKHADPSMYGDEGALELDERTGEYVVRGGGSFYPVTPDGVKPDYITWEANLEDAQVQINTLMEQFYVVTNTSPASFGQLKSGLAESGSALKRLLMAAIIKSNRMKVRYEAVIKRMIRVGSELGERNGIPNVGEVTVEWQDSIPVDERETVTNEVMRIKNGLTSLEAAIQRIDGLSGEALLKEVALIQSQSQMEPDYDRNDGRESV